MADDDDSFRELRKTERVPVKLEVGFRALAEADAEALIGIEALPQLPPDVLAQQASQGHTENLSQGGMSLTGPLQGLEHGTLPKGRKLLLGFELGDGAAPVQALAVVAWSIEGRGEHGKFTAGLMFLGISQIDLDRIGHYVEARGGH